MNHNQSYRKGGRPIQSSTDNYRGLFSNANRELPQHYEGPYDDPPSGARGFKRQNSSQCIARANAKRTRTMNDEVVLANWRADHIKMGLQPPSDGGGDDTDSVGSSSMGSYSSTQKRRMCGVSPLNKRRSMRLALKRGDTVDMVDTIARHNTVEMRTPSTLVRMNTEKRWTSWRNKRQASGSMMEKGLSSNNKMDTLAPEEDVLKKPQLLKRLSTTTGLRQAFKHAKIDEQLDIPNVFPTNSSDARNTKSAKEVLCVEKKPMKKLGGRRNAVTVMPSLDEVDGGNSSPEEPEQCLATKPEGRARLRRTSSVSNSKPRLKRGQTVEADLSDGPSAKRTKCFVGLKRSQSIASPLRTITLPSQTTWPVNCDAQVLWRVPLLLPGIVGSGRAVCVTAQNCLVSDDTGKVMVIDDKVSVQRVLQLPTSVSQITRDGQFIYAVCDDGKVYDITFSEPRLVFNKQKQGQVNCLVDDGMLIVYEKSGHVVHYDHNHCVIWKATVENVFEMVVDATNVFCSTSVGVSCLLRSTGAVVWETPLRDNATCIVQEGESLYVTCGSNVLRMTKTKGDVTKTYKAIKKGKDISPAFSCLTVGGGLVYVGGHKIVCYKEDSGAIVFNLTCPVTPCTDLQYFEGRIFCIGKASMEVVDFSHDVITKALSGENAVPVDILPKLKSPVHTPLKRAGTIGSQQQKESGRVIVECFRPKPRSSKLKVRAVSFGFNGDLDVQFPSLSSSTAGSKFIVDGLKRNETGSFYRVVGDIKALPKS